MAAPFLNGVHYVSREEERTARRSHEQDANRPDIVIGEDDLESIRLLDCVRYGISAWKLGRKVSQLA